MFTDEVLGIDKFLHNRNRVQSAFKGYKGILLFIIKLGTNQISFCREIR